MGDLLRKPWLLSAAIWSLDHAYGDDEDMNPPKLIQLAEVHETNFDDFNNVGGPHWRFVSGESLGQDELHGGSL